MLTFESTKFLFPLGKITRRMFASDELFWWANVCGINITVQFISARERAANSKWADRCKLIIWMIDCADWLALCGVRIANVCCRGPGFKKRNQQRAFQNTDPPLTFIKVDTESSFQQTHDPFSRSLALLICISEPHHDQLIYCPTLSVVTIGTPRRRQFRVETRFGRRAYAKRDHFTPISSLDQCTASGDFPHKASETHTHTKD
jgi:hypothetical protein